MTESTEMSQKEIEILKDITKIYFQRMQKEVWHSDGDMMTDYPLEEPNLNDLRILAYTLAHTYQGMDVEGQIGSTYCAEDLIPWALVGQWNWEISEVYQHLYELMGEIK